MANLIAFQTGNFSSGSNFKTVDTASSSTQLTHNNITATTTSTVYTALFSATNGAVIDGIMLHLGANSSSSTGSFTVTLADNTTTVLATVQVNLSDIPVFRNLVDAIGNGIDGNGPFAIQPTGTWMFFKFGSTVTLNSANTYKVGVSSSVAGSVQVFRSATASDWTRMLRTTTTANPGAADATFLTSDYTGGGTFTAAVITMDLTTSTTTSFGSVEIGNKGKLTYGNAASTSYRLKLAGNCLVWGGGTFNMGSGPSSGSPIPATSTALLEFEAAGQGQYGLVIGDAGQFNSYGMPQRGGYITNKALTSNVATITTADPHNFSTNDSVVVYGVDSTFNGTWTVASTPSSTTFTYTVVASNVASQASSGVCSQPILAYLTADRAAGGSALTLNLTTEWVNGDSVVLASTTRTSGQCEQKTVSSSSGTGVTLSSTVGNTHSGTLPTAAEVMHLTRNVKISGLSTGATYYIFTYPGSVYNSYFTEYFFVGQNTTAKAGIIVATSPSLYPGGTFLMNFCSVHDYAAYGIVMDSLSNDSVSILNTNFWNGPFAAIWVSQNINNYPYPTPDTVGLNILVDFCTSMLCGNSGGAHGLLLSSSNRVSITNSNGIGGNAGIYFSEGNMIGGSLGRPTGAFSNNVVHSCDGVGLNLVNGGDNFNWLGNNVTWRNNGVGLQIVSGDISDSTFQITAFGNNDRAVNTNVSFQNTTWKNCSFYGDFTGGPNQGSFQSNYGLVWASNAFIHCYFLNCSFGTPNVHALYDWYFQGSGFEIATIYGNNVLFASGTSFFQFDELRCKSQSKLGFTRWAKTAGSHRTIYTYGSILSDNVIFKTAAPSEKLQPTTVSTTKAFRLESSPKRAALANGTNTTVSVWVRQSVAGDGGAYNGSFPRVRLKANPGAGIASDVILATGSATGQGAFELLTGLTPTVTDDAVLEFVVDCNGTAGFINVDDWSVT